MKISVAVALYNGERFLYKQLDSIRTQTIQPDEVVLCDDGSSDHTKSVVEDFIKKFNLQDKWKLINNTENLGYARNFYKAMSSCQGEYIFLADQDDIWKKDKIEKMVDVMEKHPKINVLSCKFEIMDEKDQIMHGLLARKPKETYAVTKVLILDLLRGFFWPGMLMCVRKTFFEKIYPQVKDLDIAHDRVLSHLAADVESFYEFDYIGAYHRRHNNNTAQEEHRVSKLLNFDRKMRDIGVAEKLFQEMIENDLPISSTHVELIQKRLELLKLRSQALRQKSVKKIVRLYTGESKIYLRKISFLCDLWLICFGKY